MANQWFKFYGQDWLSDMKMAQLSSSEIRVWITILCLANAEDKRGEIPHCEEDTLKLKSGVMMASEEWIKLNGILKKFSELKMIEFVNSGILVTNFRKRQESNLSNYEMVNKSRQKKRLKELGIINDNNSNLIIDKVRVEKSRVDKNRIDNIYTYYQQLINKNSRLIDKAIDKIKSRLKSYSEEELKRAMENFSKDKWWMEHNAGRGVAWFFDSDNRIDQFLNINTEKQNNGRSTIK